MKTDSQWLEAIDKEFAADAARKEWTRPANSITVQEYKAEAGCNRCTAHARLEAKVRDGLLAKVVQGGPKPTIYCLPEDAP